MPLRTEAQIQAAILIALGTHPDMIVWRSAVGNGWVRTGSGFKPMRFGGVPGQADIMGCWRGRFFAIEVKTKDGRVSPQQAAWGAAVQKCGGIYIVARSVDDALDQLHLPQQSGITLEAGHDAGVRLRLAPVAADARDLHPLDASAAHPIKR